MKVLDGTELAGYLKERQAHELRALRQAWRIAPKLAVLVPANTPAVESYAPAVQQYGEEIQLAVAVQGVTPDDAKAVVAAFNSDPAVQAIDAYPLLQEPADWQDALRLIAPEKDIAGAGEQTAFDPAAATALLWLFAGYNVDLRQGKQVVIVGEDRLSERLERILADSEVQVQLVPEASEGREALAAADIVIALAGSAADLQGVRPEAVAADRAGIAPLLVSAAVEYIIRTVRRTAQNPA